MILSALNSSCNNTEASRVERERMGRWEKKLLSFLLIIRSCAMSRSRKNEMLAICLLNVYVIIPCNGDSNSHGMYSNLRWRVWCLLRSASIQQVLSCRLTYSQLQRLFLYCKKKPEIAVHSGTEDRCTAKAFHIAITLWRDNCWLYQQSTASSGLVFIRIISRRRVEQ